MYFDFSAILGIATVTSGMIVLADRLFLKRSRVLFAPQGTAIEKEASKIVQWGHFLFLPLLIVFILRAFVVEPFRIPSGSMKPTLLVGDFILVNKFIYGLRLPLFGTKLLSFHEPERGDILIFRYPYDPSVPFVKRVVGKPGDKIRYQGKVLYVNGEPLSRTSLGSVLDVGDTGQESLMAIYKEQIGETFHLTYTNNKASEDFHEISVPEGEYFVMGDNRDNSRDSRSWGFVPQHLIVGKASFIWFSWDPLLKDVRWSRIGDKLS